MHRFTHVYDHTAWQTFPSFDISCQKLHADRFHISRSPYAARKTNSTVHQVKTWKACFVSRSWAVSLERTINLLKVLRGNEYVVYIPDSSDTGMYSPAPPTCSHMWAHHATNMTKPLMHHVPTFVLPVLFGKRSEQLLQLQCHGCSALPARPIPRYAAGTVAPAHGH